MGHVSCKPVAIYIRLLLKYLRTDSRLCWDLAGVNVENSKLMFSLHVV